MAKPTLLLGHRHMENAVERLLDLDELGLKAFSYGKSHQQEPFIPSLRADMRGAKEVERLRPAKPFRCPAFERETAEFDQAGLVGMEV